MGRNIKNNNHMKYIYNTTYINITITLTTTHPPIRQQRHHPYRRNIKTKNRPNSTEQHPPPIKKFLRT